MSFAFGTGDVMFLTFPGFGPGPKFVVVRCPQNLGPGLPRGKASRSIRGRVRIDQSFSTGRTTL
jgi:hypothetical protein